MLKRRIRYALFSFLILLAAVQWADAQRGGGLGRLGSRMGGFGRGGGGGGGDSLEHRSRFEDSITLTYRYLDTTRTATLDSSISDYTTRFPIPATHVYLGNVGTATHSLLFEPQPHSGFDPGFHAFDVYKFKPEQVRFFNTTRPYTELGYMLGSQTQQLIDVIHTQNIKPYWNFSLRYRLINTPGFFQNQKANHNNYLFTSWYQSPKKRYNNYLILLNNTIQVGENGGIVDTISLKDADYKQRFDIPTRLGGNTAFSRDFKRTVLTTGNRYVETNFIMRQQYDFGRKDSLVSDSTVIPLFYPRLRFEHTFTYGKYNYKFQNTSTDAQNYLLDSAYYWDNYHRVVNASDSLLFQDQWREITNDFSIYQYPDEKNLQQFLKAGIMYQLLNGQFNYGSKTLYNLAVHGEYRNRTRNKKWDVQAYGNLYLNGYNAGDYQGYISLQRFLGRQWGSLEVGVENVNRSPSYTYDTHSSFYLDTSIQEHFSKENTAHFFGTVNNPKLNLTLGADYYLISNYLYLTHFYDLRQENTLFNVLRINASKTVRLGQHWRLYSSLWIQQKAGNADVNLPFFYTRNRLAFEGQFFRNLNLSTGLEVRYHAPYKADAYSPVLGRFYYQDSVTISNRPEIDAFFDFRIRSFKAFIRAENLNAASMSNGSFGFLNNNFAAPGYPYPGMVLRFGFYWSFVN